MISALYRKTIYTDPNLMNIDRSGNQKDSFLINHTARLYNFSAQCPSSLPLPENPALPPYQFSTKTSQGIALTFTAGPGTRRFAWQCKICCEQIPCSIHWCWSCWAQLKASHKICHGSLPRKLPLHVGANITSIVSRPLTTMCRSRRNPI